MTYDAAGFLRKTAERLRDGSIDAATAAQRIEDITHILDAQTIPSLPDHWVHGLHWTENAKLAALEPETNPPPP